MLLKIYFDVGKETYEPLRKFYTSDSHKHIRQKLQLNYAYKCWFHISDFVLSFEIWPKILKLHGLGSNIGKH